MNDNWYKLDNVSKVFLASHNKRDTRSIRVSCILKEEIVPEILQQALERTVRQYPQVQVRIRRGFFWQYLEQTDKMPKVCEEEERLCPILYGPNYKGVLHYKVTYYGRRINIDMFHAICDGTGALEILKHLVLNYLKITHEEEFDNVSFSDNSSQDDRFQNSYAHFYDTDGRMLPKTILNKKKKAYHIQGRKLAYDQLQFIEVHLETKALLKASKEMGVSLTSYLGAQLMLSIHKDMPFIQKKKPVTISMPVNLRNYYPSETLRNFFNNVDVTHVFDGNETLESLSKEFDAKLKASLDSELIKQQMNRYQSIERLFFTRMVPLVIKQPVVRSFAKKEAKRVTAVLSNLGQIKIPEEMIKYVDGFTDYCSTDKLFITATSYGDDLVLGIASAYAGTGVIKRLVKALKATGTNVRLYATEVIR